MDISSLKVLGGYFISRGSQWVFPFWRSLVVISSHWRFSVGISPLEVVGWFSSMEVLGGYLISGFFDGYFISGGSRCVFHLWRFSVGMSYITNITRVLSLSLSLAKTFSRSNMIFKIYFKYANKFYRL